MTMVLPLEIRKWIGNVGVSNQKVVWYWEHTLFIDNSEKNTNDCKYMLQCMVKMHKVTAFKG